MRVALSLGRRRTYGNPEEELVAHLVVFVATGWAFFFLILANVFKICKNTQPLPYS
jgi:hypothetical protein